MGNLDPNSFLLGFVACIGLLAFVAVVFAVGSEAGRKSEKEDLKKRNAEAKR